MFLLNIKNGLLGLCFLLLWANLFAEDNGTLYKDLCKLNKLWCEKSADGIMEEVLLGFGELPDNHTELIQAHLMLVEQNLRAQSTTHLTAKQLQNRQEGLDILRQYWKDGQFPRNTQHNVLTPYFIDDFNTACAVGHVLRETGGQSLAEQIAQENNYAFIEDMDYPELLVWAGEMGFEVDELRWIQPTYAPPISVFTVITQPECDNSGSIVLSEITPAPDYYPNANILDVETTWEDNYGNEYQGLELTGLPAGIYGFYMTINMTVSWDGIEVDTVSVVHGELYHLRDADMPTFTADVNNANCLNPTDGNPDGSIALNLPEDQVYQTTLMDYFGNVLEVSNNGFFNNLSGNIWTEIEEPMAPNYVVEIVDELGCKTYQEFFVWALSTGPWGFLDILTLDCDAQTASVIFETYGTATTVEWSDGFSGAARTDIPLGVYDVTLTDDFGCTTTEYVEVVGDCGLLIECDEYQANFVYSVDATTNTYELIDVSTGPTPIETWLWEINGEMIASGPNLTIPFAEGEIYSVCLTIGAANCTSNYCMNIEVGDIPCEPYLYYSVPAFENMTDPLIFCPEFCDIDNAFIQSIDGQICCTTSILEDACFEFVPLPGQLGSFELYILVCDSVTGECNDWLVYLEIGEEIAPPCEPYLHYTVGIAETIANPLIVCPGDCGLTGPVYIENLASTFNCSVNDLGDGCFSYVPLPGFEVIGTDSISLTVCSEETGDCVDWAVTIDVLDSVVECNYGLFIDFDPENLTFTAIHQQVPGLGDISKWDWIVDGMSVEANNVLNLSGFDNGFESVCVTIVGEDGCTDNACIDIVANDPPCAPYMYVEALPFPADGIIVCPDFCNIEGPAYIESIEGFFHCTYEILDNGCFSFAPLPGFIGAAELSVVACSETTGECSDWLIYVNLIDMEDSPGGTIFTSGLNLAVEQGGTLEIDIAPIVLVADYNIGVYTQPQNGILILDGVNNTFVYTPNVGFIGFDYFEVVVCDNETDNCETAGITIEVFDPLATVNEVVIEPDIVETDQNNSIEICVLENDQIPDDLESSIEYTTPASGTLELVGDCFIYTPNSIAQTGVFTFNYSVCFENGVCYDGLVTILVEEMDAIIAANDYESTDLNTEVIVEPLLNDYPVADPISGEFAIEIIDYPSNGTAVISTITECFDPSCQIFIYQPNVDFSGTDQFSYILCNAISCDTATVYIQVGVDCTEFCVWPGDANNNGIANNFDLLTLGYHYGFEGVPRPNANSLWLAQPAFDWEINFDGDIATSTSGTPPTDLDMKYVDCDGNGIVDENDVQPILMNYGLSHGRPEGGIEANIAEDIQIRLEIDDELVEEGSWIDVNVILEGLEGAALENIYGIAFSIDYYNEFQGVEIFPTDSIEMEFENSWFNNEGSDLTLSLYKKLAEIEEGNSVVDVAYVQTNQIGASGGGPIATMACFITGNITGKQSDKFPVYFTVTNAHIMYEDGTTEELGQSTTSTEIETSPIDPNTGILNPDLADDLTVYPNPSQGKVVLEWNKLNAKRVSLYSATGQLMLQKECNGLDKIILDLENVESGLYLLELQTKEGIAIEKIQIH